MEKEKLNLDDIKVAIFDFDDTLAIHKSKNYLEQKDQNLLNCYLKAYLNPNSFYETIEPCIISNSLYRLINFFKSNNAKIYCVSGMRFSFHLKAKENFIHKYYDNDIEFISSANQELKIDAIKVIQSINNCKLNEILFVDDMEENIKRFKIFGIHALLPNEVDSIIDEKNQI